MAVTNEEEAVAAVLAGTDLSQSTEFCVETFEAYPDLWYVSELYDGSVEQSDHIHVVRGKDGAVVRLPRCKHPHINCNEALAHFSQEANE